MSGKTFGEQIADLKATRADLQKQMEAVAQKSIDEARAMDSAEGAEFDALENKIKTIDTDIERFSRLESMQSKSAKPVDDEAKSAQTRLVTDPASVSAVQVKNTEKVEQGIGFARIARCLALSHIHHTPAVQIAKSLYDSDDKLIKTLTKAAVPAANTGSATWASNLINEGGIAFADFVEYLRPRTLFGRIQSRLRNLPFDTPVLIQSSGGTAAWVPEGGAKPLTQWTYTRAKLAPLKVAAIAAITKELLNRASPSADALIRDELARSVGATIDSTFIDPAAAAVPGESPGSITNGVAALTFGGGADYDAVRCDVAVFMNAFADNNLSLNGAFWIMPERVAIALSLMTTPLGQQAFPSVNFEGGTFFGLPVFVTSYADTDSNGSVVALVKGDEIFVGDEGGIQVAMSDQASLIMDNDPSGSSVTPTAAQVVSMFQTNSVAILVERYLNWQRRRAQAVSWGRVNWDAFCS